MSKYDTVSEVPMKKVERINTIMRYINNRAHFTISEIMQEFNISRSTAIRDIREIEAIGMPLVAEVGREGGIMYYITLSFPLFVLPIMKLKLFLLPLWRQEINNFHI